MKKGLLKLKSLLVQTNYILFCVFTSLYLILLGLETHQGGFITYYFDFNLFLGPIFITGLILAFSKEGKDDKGT